MDGRISPPEVASYNLPACLPLARPIAVTAVLNIRRRRRRRRREEVGLISD